MAPGGNRGGASPSASFLSPQRFLLKCGAPRWHEPRRREQRAPGTAAFPGRSSVSGGKRCRRLSPRSRRWRQRRTPGEGRTVRGSSVRRAGCGGLGVPAPPRAGERECMAQWSERRAVRVRSGVSAGERARSELRGVMEDLCKLRVCWVLLVSGVVPPATDSE